MKRLAAFSIVIITAFPGITLFIIEANLLKAEKIIGKERFKQAKTDDRHRQPKPEMDLDAGGMIQSSTYFLDVNLSHLLKAP
jgi:hypothetical protein